MCCPPGSEECPGAWRNPVGHHREDRDSATAIPARLSHGFAEAPHRIVESYSPLLLAGCQVGPQIQREPWELVFAREPRVRMRPCREGRWDKKRTDGDDQ